MDLPVDRVRTLGEAEPNLLKTSAETRPGPVRGTSWKEVQPLESHPTLEDDASLSSASSGIEEIRFKDLDTGKELIIPKTHTIRDLSTGQLFALCKDPPEEAGQEQNGTQYFTDIASGEQLSVEQLQVALGLRPDPKKLRRDSETSSQRTSISQSNGPAKKSKSWLSLKFRNKKKIENTESDSESPGSTPKVGDEYSIAASSGLGRGPVRVSAHKKAVKELSNLSLVQELPAHNGIIWAMKFSHNGRYLATAGQDCKVYVWEVLAPASGTKTNAETEKVKIDVHLGPHELRDASGAVFRPEPVKIYAGHSRDVLDISWSQSQFLLTASMDGTVKLWHVSTDQCLRVFKHSDFVTAVDFHPRDDKHFVSGSLDGKIRVWNIPDRPVRVVDYADLHEIVTAVTFSADGSQVIVGTMKGKCQFHTCDQETFKLQYQAQIDVKNRRGRGKNKKITGIQAVPNAPQQTLITSNDSRIRVYNSYQLLCKYKGLHNANTQIKASFSEDGQHIICGSDDGACFVWNNAGDGQQGAQHQSSQIDFIAEKSSSFESFQAHDEITTVAIFAPTSLQILLKEGEDHQLSTSDGRELTSKHAFLILTAGYDGRVRIWRNL